MTRKPTFTIQLTSLSDHGSGAALPSIFESYWPAYRRWIERSETRDPELCMAKLREHMPELVPVYDALLARIQASEQAARFLTLWNPPRIVRACSQLVHETRDGPGLIRTYDHHPALFDGLILSASWAGTNTLCVTDCIWGALDGINEHGLAVALAFGGRRATGDGFAAPLLVRYLLQTCENVAQARKVLRRLPVSMAYTFVVLDSCGDFVTAYLGPGRTVRFVERRASTNHQGRVEWRQYVEHVQSDKRLRALEGLLGDGADSASIEKAFLSPPVWRENYGKGAGTLYVSRYSPESRRMELIWPDARRQWCVGDKLGEEFDVEIVGTLSPSESAPKRKNAHYET